MSEEPSQPLANAFMPNERESKQDMRQQLPASYIKDDPYAVTYTRKGEYRGFRYEILFDRDRQLVNGSIDGPDGNPDRILLTDDPDRWAVLTDVDAMTDERSWRIVNHRTGLSIWMAAPGEPVSVCLSRADFPDRDFSIRVDGNEAIDFGPGTCSTTNVRLLFDQLMEGDKLITRGYEWPYDFPKDKKGDASPFQHAHALFMHMYRLVKRRNEITGS